MTNYFNIIKVLKDRKRGRCGAGAQERDCKQDKFNYLYFHFVVLVLRQNPGVELRHSERHSQRNAFVYTAFRT